QVRQRAARAWTDWETATIPAPPRSVARFEDPEFRMGFARTVTHYWGNDHFLGEAPDEGVVLRDAHLLKGIPGTLRSEEHTSELQSRENLVCRLLLEKKKKNTRTNTSQTTIRIRNSSTSYS